MTCDDPKGVVECGSIRKYRTSSHKMKDNKTRSRRTTAEDLEETSLLTNKQDKEVKVSTKGYTERPNFDPSSLQLVEVSRGAERLNNMIESWSKGMKYDERSEDIARDLLKGALDLQESLEMLRKVQEASRYMSRSKREQNDKPERSRIEEEVMDRTTHSNQLGVSNKWPQLKRGEACQDHSHLQGETEHSFYPMGFQRASWPSGDGCSSGSCREELKKVIKESLVRQNLLPSTSSEALESASVFPSTSSSQSSLVWNDRLSDSSLSSTASRKERGPNLVAKLMGLEEKVVPSRSTTTSTVVMQKQLESQRILNQKRPIFEIDMPKVRKNGSIVDKVNNPEQHKTLREILETTHFNGVLKKSTSVRENKLQVHHTNDSDYKHFDDLPPIVLMKPRYTPYPEFIKTYEPVPPEESSSFRNLKPKAVPSKTFKPREGSTTNMGKEIEEHVSKRVTKVERPKRLKEVVELDDVKEIKPVENEKAQGGKVKLHSHASHKSQVVSETVEKKAKVKAVTISRKLPEKEVSISKHKAVTKAAQDQGEISSTSAKLRKPQSVLRIAKNEIPCRKSTASNSNTIPKPKNQKTNNSKEQRKNQMKKQSSVAEPEAAKPVVSPVLLHFFFVFRECSSV